MTFSIGFCFLPGETEEDFIWAFQCFQELGISPKIIVIDGDQAQKNASKYVFPHAPTLLCVWHINQDFVHCPSDFDSDTSKSVWILCDFNVRRRLPEVNNIPTQFWKVTYGEMRLA